MGSARLSTLTAVFVVACSGNHPVPVKPIGLSPTSGYPPVKADADLDELLDAGPDPCYQASIMCNRACRENRCDCLLARGSFRLGAVARIDVVQTLERPISPWLLLSAKVVAGRARWCRRAVRVCCALCRAVARWFVRFPGLSAFDERPAMLLKVVPDVLGSECDSLKAIGTDRRKPYRSAWRRSATGGRLGPPLPERAHGGSLGAHPTVPSVEPGSDR